MDGKCFLSRLYAVIFNYMIFLPKCGERQPAGLVLCRIEATYVLGKRMESVGFPKFLVCGLLRTSRAAVQRTEEDFTYDRVQFSGSISLSCGLEGMSTDDHRYTL